MGHLTNETTLAFYCIEKNMGMDQPAHTIHSDRHLCFPPVFHLRKYTRYTWFGLKFQDSCQSL